MKVNSEVFRAYDIRGIVDEELTPKLVENIGKAIGSEVLERKAKDIYVGRDGRLSGKEISGYLIQGILKTGCNVIDIGMVHTPLLYFATFKGNTGNGVMVTGSHNPKNYNGFKIVLDRSSLKEKEILLLKKRIEDGNFLTGKGELSNQSFDQTYIDKMNEKIILRKKLKVVLDCGNGAGSVLGPTIFKKFSDELIELFCEVDGSFPNHHPDPSDPKNLSDLIKAVKLHKADIGIALDGDGDRLGVVDSDGEIIYPDRYLSLMSKDILERYKESKIVFDVKCSNQLKRTIEKHKGIPIMTKTGHSYIKSEIKKNNAALGGEMSGHIFYNEEWYGFDDGIFSGLKLLEILSNQKKTSHEVFNEFPNMFNTPEIKISTDDKYKFEVISKLKNNFKPEGFNAITIDGLRLEGPKSWGLIRASNTTPSLVLRFEAETNKELESIKELFQKELFKINSKLKF